MRFVSVFVLAAALLIHLAFPSKLSAQSPTPDPSVGTSTPIIRSRHNTIAHEMLLAEGQVFHVTQAMSDFIDDFIDEVVRSVPRLPSYNLAQARDALKAIDDILVRRSVIYPLQSMHWTLLLAEGLQGRMLTAEDAAAAQLEPHNARRAEHIRQNLDKPFFVLDCDTAAFLYLAAAEALRMPLFLMEVPSHNFIRFRGAEGDLDWETMDGVERPAGFYQRHWQVSPVLIENGVFLTPMSRNEVLGYHRAIIGGVWMMRGVPRMAISLSAQSVQLRPRGAGALNNYAWYLVTDPAGSPHDRALALEVAGRRLALWRTPNALDTFACALAARGDFQNAIAVEREAAALHRAGGYGQELEVPDFAATLAKFAAGQSCTEEPEASQRTQASIRNLLIHTSERAGAAARPN